ncbi:protein translocase subunit SecD [Undibacterium fentianense]|uniref:Protein translocase subunit SecD n=1 Tax=Undibacterium fentianense TaxID=2828728 RepID=A0A941E0H7_9BURK|nr:protein translocase subunit SecD [Undibacterium fentianense]MBR7800949.1 protein translocase subunit SecD [Undibacterium fentianense]
MNRYPLWKYIIILITLVFGALYTAPNFFGDSPAVQINSAKATIKVDNAMIARVEQILKDAGISSTGYSYDYNGIQGSVRARFLNTDVQFKAKAALEKNLNPDPSDPVYTVALNLLPNTPEWMQKLHAFPMYLGLDLRGGVHFLMKVDTSAVLNNRLNTLQASIRSTLKEKEVRHAGISRDASSVTVKFRDAEIRAKARDILARQMNDVSLVDSVVTPENPEISFKVSMKPDALTNLMNEGVKQNISALSKRVNEIGVAEPIIQQQGADRIVVQLPGVQDVARAKAIIGRTATLEVRLVDESVIGPVDENTAVPFGSEMFKVGRGGPAILYKDPIVTGDAITGAQASFDQNQQPAVSIDLNSEGGRRMGEATRQNVGKRMAFVLFEKGKGELLQVATIQGVFSNKFQTTGMRSTNDANELALLLRAGALAAPMEVIEERTIGAQLGAENITKGIHSTMYGFAAIAVFMIIYYMMFGFFSVFALAVNLLLLVGILSVMQATLTLPGMAAIALALGMAIDANVLINERIREELRAGNSPQNAILQGFDRAWATILDSNVTTLIVGLALLVFGSGPIKAFAIVHCLGILTSIFSAVFVSRGVVNLWYGRKKKLASVSIGQIWKPAD